MMNLKIVVLTVVCCVVLLGRPGLLLVVLDYSHAVMIARASVITNIVVDHHPASDSQAELSAAELRLPIHGDPSRVDQAIR